MNENINYNTGQPNDPREGEVFHHFTDVLRRFFHARVQDHEIADDLTQETLLRVYRAQPTLFNKNREGEVRSYVYAAARSVFANYVRERSRHPTVELSDQARGDARIADASEHLDQQMLWKQIQRLSDVEQAVLTMQFQHSLSLRQIALKLHKSENAVKLISSRARAKLKKYEKK